MSSVRLRRLQADFEKLSAYAQRHPRVRLVQVEGTPPEKYQVEFQIRSLKQSDDQLTYINRHLVEISIPRNYPRMPPQCRMLTPVFHPNIAPHAICIGDHWNAGEPLWSMVMRIGEMLAYQSYNTKSPLNGEAARWVEQNEASLPLDPVPLYVDQVAQPSAAAAATAPGQVATARVVKRAPSSKPAASQTVPAARAVQKGPSASVSPAPGMAKPRPDLPRARPVGTPDPEIARPPARKAAGADGSIHCVCPGCRTPYDVPAAMAGKNARCKKCRTIIAIPSQ